MRRRLSVLAALVVLYLLCLRAYYVGFFNDDAFYIVGARSLLQGRYVELSSPDGRPLDNYPPGYPLLLAAWALPTGGSPLAFQLLSVLLTAATLVLLWRCLRAAVSERAADAAALAVGASPLVAGGSGVVLSEVPFTALCWAVVDLARRLWPSKGWRPWLGLGLLCGYAGLIRLPGAALGAAVAAALARERRWRAAGACLAGSLALLAPYLFRNMLLTGRAETRISELADSAMVSSLPATAAGNLAYYLREVFVTALFRWPVEALAWPTALAAAGLAALGARRWAQGWRAVVPAWLIVYGLILLAWPYQASRYAWPVLGFAVAMLFSGLERWRRAVPAALALALLLEAPTLARIARASLLESTPLTTPPRRTFAWISANTPEDAVFAAALDGRLYHFTGRKAFQLPKARQPQELADWLEARRVDYVLAFPTDLIMKRAGPADRRHDPTPAQALDAWLSADRRFRPLFRDAGEGSALYGRGRTP